MPPAVLLPRPPGTRTSGVNGGGTGSGAVFHVNPAVSPGSRIALVTLHPSQGEDWRPCSPARAPGIGVAVTLRQLSAEFGAPPGPQGHDGAKWRHVRAQSVHDASRALGSPAAGAQPLSGRDGGLATLSPEG